ncbi:MAG: nucleoside hydrolase [Candidatus Obscuribacterales bacterium]|nr:nucleoside hydrolase [Candidatus Obscuribacterales bacterium]
MTTATPTPENMDLEQLFQWFTDRVTALRQRLVVIGDFGEDLDDEDTLLLHDGERRKRELGFLNTHGSRRQDLFELKAVVANLAPPLERARLAKGTLKSIGQGQVPVGVGTDCGNAVGEKLKKLQGIPYMADSSEVEEAAPLLLRTLQEADDKSLTLVLISGLTDIAAVLREHAALVKAKVRSVAIMGGVTVVKNTDHVFINDEGYFEPDDAANNKFDMESAKFVYRRFQELQIPLVILTRFAAGACQVPRSFYDKLAATGHPVGVKLLKAQQDSIESLWKRANMTADDPHREKLPARCDKTWFCDTFLAGAGLDRTSNDTIWDLVVSFNLYDPMTLIAAIPELRKKFFDPTEVAVHGTVHLIIGVTKVKHSVRDAERLAAYMTARCLESLTLSKAEVFPKAGGETVTSIDVSPPIPPPETN